MARLATANAARPQAPRWDLVDAPIDLADRTLQVSRPQAMSPAQPIPVFGQEPAPAAAVATVIPEAPQLAAGGTPPEPRINPASKDRGSAPSPVAPLPPNLAEIDRGADLSGPPGATEADRTEGGVTGLGSRIPELALRADRRLRPERFETIDRNRAGMTAMLVPERGTPGRGPESGPTRPGPAVGPPKTGQGGSPLAPLPLDRSIGLGGQIPPARATPKPRPTPSGRSGLAALSDRPGVRTLAEIPKIYQSRLDPDRSSRAAHWCERRQRAGRRACPRLADPPSGRRRPLGWRDRSLRGWNAREGRR